MRKLIYIIIIIFLGCKESRFNEEKSSMKTFTCSFIGNNDDISAFFGKEKYEPNNIKLLIFGDLYNFHKKGKSIRTYSKTDSIIETYRVSGTSGQYKGDRKYKIQSIDSSKKAIKLILQSGDRTFTQLKGKSIIIDCTEIKH